MRVPRLRASVLDFVQLGQGLMGTLGSLIVGLGPTFIILVFSSSDLAVSDGQQRV